MSAQAVVASPAPSIFISYAADDPQWPAATVETLAWQLSEAGATVYLDRWAERDRGRLSSNDEWRQWMRDHLALADHVLCLSSDLYARLGERQFDTQPAGRGVAFESVELESWLYERKQNNRGRIWLFRPDGAKLPRYLQDRCPVYAAPQQQGALVNHLCRPSTASRQDALRRRMLALIDEECIDLYVTLSGRHEQERISRVHVPQSVRRHMPAGAGTGQAQVISEHDDLLEVVQANTRAILLGEPGAGKTFALLKVLQADLDAGQQPLWIKLNHWLDGAQSFEQFVVQEVPDLGEHWQAHVASGGGRLLIDGLNELPAEHAAAQARSLAAWLLAHPSCPVLISCRDTDMRSNDFGFLRERLTIRPLRARQIRRFVGNYLAANGFPDAAAADGVFWPMVGGEQIAAAWAKRPTNTPESLLDDLAEGRTDRATWLDEAEHKALVTLMAEPAQPYAVATNPYLLALMLWVWIDDIGGRGSTAVPRHRIDVFDRYASARVCDELEKTHCKTLNADAVQDAHSSLAAQLQHVAERANKAREAGVLAIPWAEVEATQRVALSIALGARLLRREGELIRFRHQLLQEFYVARYLRARLVSGSTALLEGVWSVGQPLWERAGWLQPFLLLAEYQETDLPALLRTLVDIQPEVAGDVWEQTRRLNPALLTETLAAEVRNRLTAQMLPAKPSADFPLREATCGRGLGLMRLADGRPLDRRPGVWGWYDPHSRRAKVEIDWVRIPSGRFTYQGKPASIERDYLISKYPITHSQFQAFVEDPTGWANPKWWPKTTGQEREELWKPSWRYENHPCTDVSWWAAQAYCRWLSAQHGQVIELPTEHQWERAAAGTSGADYPWGKEWLDRNANAQKSLSKTSFCGLFEHGSSSEGVNELAGNVLEWTCERFYSEENGWWPAFKYFLLKRLNIDLYEKEDEPERAPGQGFTKSPSSDPGEHHLTIATRGGSWDSEADKCRTKYRERCDASMPFHIIGFRVVSRGRLPT